MSFQAYIDAVEAKSGKTMGELKAIAASKGLIGPTVKATAVYEWLFADYGIGRGHAMAVYSILKSEGATGMTSEEHIASHFTGGKAHWRPVYDQLLAQVQDFGPGVAAAPTDTYISLVRDGKKFAVVAFTADRMDIGIKLKSVAPTARFAVAGSWNAMLTHRVQITDPAQIDAEVMDWLEQAYAVVKQ